MRQVSTWHRSYRMVNLKLRTEYIFRTAYGRISEIIDVVKGDAAAGIADIHSTWGHYDFHKMCKKESIKPILGVQLNVVRSLEHDKKQAAYRVTLLARNIKGLQEIYRINGNSYGQMYYL